MSAKKRSLDLTIRLTILVKYTAQLPIPPLLTRLLEHHLPLQPLPHTTRLPPINLVRKTSLTPINHLHKSLHTPVLKLIPPPVSTLLEDFLSFGVYFSYGDFAVEGVVGGRFEVVVGCGGGNWGEDYAGVAAFLDCWGFLYG